VSSDLGYNKGYNKERKKEQLPATPKAYHLCLQDRIQQCDGCLQLYNSLVAKYPSSEERRAISSNGSKASANEEDTHYGKASVGRTTMTHSAAKHLLEEV
jgi:hypothetical protein